MISNYAWITFNLIFIFTNLILTTTKTKIQWYLSLGYNIMIIFLFMGAIIWVITYLMLGGKG